jgi:hypothetical protein
MLGIHKTGIHSMSDMQITLQYFGRVNQSRQEEYITIASPHNAKSAIRGRSFNSMFGLICKARTSTSKIYPRTRGFICSNSDNICDSNFLLSLGIRISSISILLSRASGSVRHMLIPLKPRQRLYS